jgi:hypothetical protein
VYVWARFDGLTATGTFVGCMGLTDMDLDLGAYDLSAGSGGVAGGGLAEHGSPFYFFGTSQSTTAVLETTAQTLQASHTGSGYLFLGARLGLVCPSGNVDGGAFFGPNTIVSGTQVSWDSADGG